MSEEKNKCKDCQKKLGDVYYRITTDDEIVKQYKEAQYLVLCPACWQQKNEEYKEQFKKGEIEITKTTHNESGLVDSLLTTCKSCQKWSDEYEPVIRGSLVDYDFCSANCKKKFENQQSAISNQQSAISNQQSAISNQAQSKSTSEQDLENKTNYLPWILGGVGVVSLIGIITYFILKNKRGIEE